MKNFKLEDFNDNIIDKEIAYNRYLDIKNINEFLVSGLSYNLKKNFENIFDFIKYCIYMKADINSICKAGYGIYNQICSNIYLTEEFLNWMLDNGLKIDKRSVGYRYISWFWEACRRGKMRMWHLQWLIKNGSDYKSKEHGLTPYEVAMKNKNNKTISLLHTLDIKT